MLFKVMKTHSSITVKDKFEFFSQVPVKVNEKENENDKN